MPTTDRRQALLRQIYPEPQALATAERLTELAEAWRPRLPRLDESAAALTERDAVLITYGDQVQAPGEPPLQTLAEFCRRHLAGLITGVHVLPFFPWSSDDGFSVKDYRAVAPELGGWEHIEMLGRTFRLMVDGVINHASAQGAWFQGFQRGDPAYQDFFITVAGDPDLSQVVRPRALPLLTEVQTAAGPRRVWTTFSADQVDLNFANPAVLLEIADILLEYVARGAQFLRLDAIAYLWKEIGTNCLHRPQTHAVVQLLRALLDDVAPHVRLITETNVPHADNLSYFGDGANEAHLVYNFALPPLVLHALRTGETQALTTWAASLRLPSDGAAFFNFLASHDGVGLNPARGLLPAEALEAVAAGVLAHGGRISYKHNADGTQSPYELNINYFDALSDPAGDEPLGTPVDRFMAAQAILLALAGLPGIYFHSLFGSRGWPEGAALTGHNRTLNRQKLQRASLERELADPASLRGKVFARYGRLLRARAASPAFQPQAGQRVIEAGPGVFAVLRTARTAPAAVLAVHNLTGRPRRLALPLPDLLGGESWARELVTGRRVRLARRAPLTLAPYAVVWLTGLGNKKAAR
ncbi:MAG: sugar phosphorylase [Anaerolineales bacterium]|nr:sugar phosphorylase [Anaerolineales bacterium]